MDNSRAAKLTYLRFQVRSLKQQERRLLQLHDQHCNGGQSEAAEELARVRQHVQEAEDALMGLLGSGVLSR